MSARNFVWLSIGGGAWSLGANWNDTTDGIDPSLVPPGAADSVTIGGPTGTGMQTITGPGQAAAALFTGNTLLSGNFSIAQLTLGQVSTGGLLELAAGTALTSGAANVVSGSLLVGNAAFSVAGALTLGDAASGSSAALNVTSGGRASVLSLFMASGADGIYVDPASVLEVGGGIVGLAGQLTVDAGAALSGQGNANAYGVVANNGTIEATTGTLALGRLSGTGTLVLDTGATLKLNGACASGQSVDFSGANATLAFATEFDAPAGIVTGFATGDALDVRGSTISQATYQAGAAGLGTLTLYYGSQVADRITLAGTYTGAAFLTSGDGAGGTLITLAEVSPGSGKPSPGTATPDQFVWTGAGSGKWNSVLNWSDTTRNQAVAAIPPGVNDLCAIAGGASTFTVVSGPADAATLEIIGEVGLSGTYAIGTLTAGLAAGTPGTLDLLAVTTVTAASAIIADGAISVAGSGSVLSVSGALVLGGGPSGIGLPITALGITAGGVVQAASLTVGGGSGDSIITDPTGILEVGTAGGAAAGAVTIDSGAVLSGNGSVNPFGAVVDNGTILASGGTLSLGAVSGSGSLVVAANAELELLGATALPITLEGSVSAGGAVLSFANARVAPSGTITGFVPGDILRLEGSSLTGLSFTPSNGVLSLLYGTSVVAKLTLAGSFANLKFVQAPDGANGTLIGLASTTGTGGSPGQSGTDTLAWTNPVSGGWSRAGAWTDVTTGNQAQLPPGAQNQVQIAGPTGIAFATISGTGTCASLAASGNLVFAGTFSTGTLSVAAGATVSMAAATVLSCGVVAVDSATLVDSGTLSALSVSGTMSLTGSQALLAVQAKAGAQCAGLMLGGDGDGITVDPTAWMNVGSTGFTALGAVTIDAGFEVSGAGNLNLFGTIVDSGTIAATDGTLWLGAVSGTGQVSIGTGATLALTAGEPCPIAFTGGAATLEIAGPITPSAIISGFAPGDAILFADTPADSVAYQAGPSGLGTLTIGEAGQTIGQLVLAGNYVGQVWGVQPSGTGAEITLSPSGTGNVPIGTVTPDSYVWTGGQGAAWSASGNWSDTTQGQTPAAVAPGLNDLVTIDGGAGSTLEVTGPADAASLNLSGTVALQGGFAVGTLSVAGVLGLAAGGTLEAGSATVTGGIALAGGVLAVDSTIALGPSAVLAATGGSIVYFGAVRMAAGSALTTDAQTGIEVGGRTGAAPGMLSIDADGIVSGAGVLEPSGTILDQGAITASGGTLTLGNVSGTGTLEVGVAATLALQGTAAPGMRVDFGAGGTLTIGQTALSADLAVSGFGTGDTVLLQTAAPADTAFYVEDAPGTGTLFIDSGGQVIAQLTLLGDQSGLSFGVSGGAGGATILTATPEKISDPGGGIVTNPNDTNGPIELNTLIYTVQQDLTLSGRNPDYLITALSNLGTFALNTEVYGWFWDGQAPTPDLGVFPGIEVVLPINAVTGTGIGPGSTIMLQAGFKALILEGSENQTVIDPGFGNSLLVSNDGTDTLIGGGFGDTLVGAPGGNTLFQAAALQPGVPVPDGYDITMIGGGNDTFITGRDLANITTSTRGHSTLFVGGTGTLDGTSNTVVLNGADTLISSGGIVEVTVSAPAGAGQSLLFGSPDGLMTVTEGATPCLVIGSSGSLVVKGGSANGGQVWGDDSSLLQYSGGTGSALVVAGSGMTEVSGGFGPMTVFGGTGSGLFGGANDNQLAGAPGSAFVIGGGPSTIHASTGVGIWISGGAAATVVGTDGAEVYATSSFANNLFAGPTVSSGLFGPPTFAAGTGNETLWGGQGNDTFIVGAGKNLLATGGGFDTFVLNAGQTGGTDAILGFSGQDTIQIHGYSAAPQISYGYGDCVVNLADGTRLILFGVNNLSANSIVNV